MQRSPTDSGHKPTLANVRFRGSRQAISDQNHHMLSDLNDSQRALAESMSLLSEAGYHAGWMAGLEYDLWRAVIEGPFRYGQLDLTDAHVERLRGLSDACGGWIVFDSAGEETFVPISHWNDIYRGRGGPPEA
jgi:hypothetical protein